MTRRIIATFLVGSAVIYGCQRSTPETIPMPTPTIPGAIPQPSPVLTHTRKWSITTIDQKLDYRSTRVVALRHMTDAAQPPDSFTTTADFSITPKRTSSTASYLLEIRSIHSTSAQPVVHVPFSFAGHLSDSRLKIEALNGVSVSSVIDCSTGELSFAGLATQTMISTPTQIEIGTTWSDSLSTVACTGPIPGVLSITRTYRPVSSTKTNGLETIILELNEKITLTGEGSQDQHRVQIHGTGSGRGQLMIDATSGAVVSANTDRLAFLVVTASGREQQFQQHVNEILVRIQ